MKIVLYYQLDPNASDPIGLDQIVWKEVDFPCLPPQGSLIYENEESTSLACIALEVYGRPQFWLAAGMIELDVRSFIQGKQLETFKILPALGWSSPEKIQSSPRRGKKWIQ
jgi:hypothetical protein